MAQPPIPGFPNPTAAPLFTPPSLPDRLCLANIRVASSTTREPCFSALTAECYLPCNMMCVRMRKYQYQNLPL